MLKRVIFIGKSNAGKTTLCQKIRREELRYLKTQTISTVDARMIDTPGEYLENRRLRFALMAAAVETNVIALVQDATEHGTMFPQAYASVFNKPVIGIVTKCDLADPSAVERARDKLLLAGAEKIFETSGTTGEGVNDLVEYLNY